MGYSEQSAVLGGIGKPVAPVSWRHLPPTGPGLPYSQLQELLIYVVATRAEESDKRSSNQGCPGSNQESQPERVTTIPGPNSDDRQQDANQRGIAIVLAEKEF